MGFRLPTLGGHVYPSPSAGKGDGRVGRTPFLRCVQCGLPNDTRKTAWSESGDGLKVDTEDPPDRSITGGCRFCGSLKWRRGKPTALPDGRNLPSDEWKGRRR